MFKIDKNSITKSKTRQPKMFIRAALSNSVSYGSNVGTGTITEVNAPLRTVSEVWTLTCISTATDGGTFSVEGSVSGVKEDAVVGTFYDNSLVSFTINDGNVDYDIGDIIVITIVRDIVENTTKYLFSTLLVEVTGDISVCSIDVLAALGSSKFLKTDSVVLTVDDLLAGGVVKEMSSLVVTESKGVIKDAAITDSGLITVYVL